MLNNNLLERKSKGSGNILFTNKNLIDNVRPFNARRQPENNNLLKELKNIDFSNDLISALRSNDLKTVDSFLKKGMNPNQFDSKGNTMFYYALPTLTKNMANLLLNHKADPDIMCFSKESPVHILIKNSSTSKDIEAIKLVISKSKNIDQKDRDGYTALQLAVDSKQTKLIDAILKQKANPDIATPRGNTPLHLALINSDAETSIKLIQAGADVNLPRKDKLQPLSLALYNNMTPVVEELLKYKANPNTMDGLTKSTPLNVAIKNNNIDTFNLLLHHKSKLNIALSDGNSELMNAVERGNLEMVEKLLALKVDLNLVNSFGDNALLISAKNGNVDITNKLLSAGMDINFKNTLSGKTSLHYAAKNGHFDMATLLVNKKANVNIQDNEGYSPIVDVLPDIRYARVLPKPTEKQSNIINLLLKNGTNIEPYKSDNFFIARLADTLNVNHKDSAKEFLFGTITNEWNRINRDRLDHVIDSIVLKNKFSTVHDADKAVLTLLHPDIDLYNETEAVRHASHLRSWRGNIKIDNKPNVNAEGWWMHVYPPLKIKSYLSSLNDIQHNKVDCQRKFGENKEIIVDKLKKEIISQMTTYYSQRHQDMHHMITDREFKGSLKNFETSKYCEEITKTKPGDEFAIASGFPGHAIYIGFRKQPDEKIARVIYNLGGLANIHHMTPDGLIYPHVVGDIPSEIFNKQSPEAVDYIKGIISAKIGEASSPAMLAKLLYTDASNLGGRYITEDIPAIPQKRQLVGNCVLKNNNVSSRNRFKNDRLFDWLKTEEKKFADEISQIDKNIIADREKDKDINSFKYIVDIYSQNKNIDAAVTNLNRFLEKRCVGDLKEATKLRDVERTAYFLTNLKEKDLDSFMMQRGAIDMINTIAEKRYCDPLKQVVNHYKNNSTLASIYSQLYRAPYGK